MSNITALKESRIVKENAMLVQNGFINSKQLLYMAQKTPIEAIYRRPGKGGKTFTYVKAWYVKKVLNYVFGWLWDFQILDKGREQNQVWTQGRLAIRNKNGEIIIIKEQFGRADIKFLTEKVSDGANIVSKKTERMVDYGNDLKAAASDALKKCASELGIASDVYNQEEDIEIGLKPLSKKEEAKEAKRLVEDIIADIRISKSLRQLESAKKGIEADDKHTPAGKKLILEAIEQRVKEIVK